MHQTLDPSNLHVAVDIMIMTIRGGRLNVLLSRRTAPPFEDDWALPGRLVALDESADETVRRLMDEMLPISEVFFEQLYTFSGVDRDPRGRVVSIAYLVIAPWEHIRGLLRREGVTLRCFDIILRRDRLTLTGMDGTQLTSDNLAFDHGHIIETGIGRLRGKLDYTDIGFHFLDNKQCFSLNTLLTIYTAILERDIDPSNFRRMIHNRYESAGSIRPTDKAERSGRGRPATLYTLVDMDNKGGDKNDRKAIPDCGGPTE